MSELRASIDIGSNSCLLLVGEVLEGKVIKILESHSYVTGLGRELDINKSFLKTSMDETFEALGEYAQIVKKYNLDPKNIVATATEASRVAQNAPDFFKKIKLEIGIDVQIINAEGEAYYSATGVLCDSNELKNPLFVLDIGGASTEIIKLNLLTRDIESSFSMPVGSVRYTSWLEKNIQNEKMNEVFEDYEQGLASAKTDFLCCVAGTMTSIANMYLKNPNFEESEVHGLKLSSKNIFDMQKKYEELSPDEFLNIFPFLGKRCQTIKGGIAIICSIINKLGVKELYVSTYGLRYGTLVSGRIKDEFIA